jgi:hypothetical protein
MCSDEPGARPLSGLPLTSCSREKIAFFGLFSASFRSLASALSMLHVRHLKPGLSFLDFVLILFLDFIS